MWQSEETVILPLPSNVAEIRQAAEAYLEQYGVMAQMWIRGQVTGEGSQVMVLPTWQSIVRVDEELGVVGLGDLDQDDEQLLWVLPSGPGELRLTAVEEEN